MLFLLKGPLVWVLVLILGPMSALLATEIKDTLLSRPLPASDRNNPCYEDLSMVALGIFGQEEWALKMLDAIGKPEAGTLEGNVIWPGSYEHCLGIKRGPIEGQHCWLQAAVETTSEMRVLPATALNIPLIGICLPNSCKNKHFLTITNFTQEIVNKARSLIPFNGSLALAIDCEYRNIEMNVTSFVATFISCILLLFVVLGTSADVLGGKTRDKKIDRNGETTEVESKFRAAFTRFALYFSLYSNGRKLFALDNASSDVTFGHLNGLKVIATAMVILAHTHSLFAIAGKNPVKVMAQYGRWFLQPFLQTYEVELFFFVTGFLTLNGVVRRPLVKNKIRFLFTYVLHRYFKMLAAPLTIVLVAKVAIKPRLSSGPFWNLWDRNCSNVWWQMVLFVTNFSCSDSSQCFSIWWFLSVSVQLHLISLLIIIPLIYRRYRLSILSGSGMLVYTWSWLAWKAHRSLILPLHPERDGFREMMTYVNEQELFFDNIYYSPICHLTAYVLGMALAWVLFKHRRGLSLTKIMMCVGWTVSWVFLFLALYGIYLRPNRMLRKIHLVLSNTAYTLFVAWVVFICDAKNTGVVSRVLRWKYWLPLSKLSLTTFLLHMMVIECFYLSEYERMTYSLPLLVVFFVRHWVVTYLVATLFTLSVEMPLNAIVDSFFKVFL